MRTFELLGRAAVVATAFFVVVSCALALKHMPHSGPVVVAAHDYMVSAQQPRRSPVEIADASK